MKKLKNIILIILVLSIIVSPRIYWQLKSATPIDIAIIDKTVPTNDYREHLGLHWVLMNEKITKNTGELYDLSKDYFGYDPLLNKPMADYRINRELDVIYIADTYGVYSDDLEVKVEGERSNRIYGGMTTKEWQSILHSKGKETLLIAEYNSFATPTDEETRSLMEKTLNVKWSGWTGRYFDNLNGDEIPPWLIQNYEKQYNQKWNFENGGIAFVHLSDQVVVIDEKDLNSKVLFQLTGEGKKQFSSVKNTDYPYWFDIVTPTNNATVYGQYVIDLNNKAIQQLKSNNIPTTFPAIIHQTQEKTYYFAGDYADYPKDNLMKWENSNTLLNIFSSTESNFHWSVYVPMMQRILQDFSETNQK